MKYSFQQVVNPQEIALYVRRCGFVADAVEHYYWEHGNLPEDWTSIKDYVLDAYPEIAAYSSFKWELREVPGESTWDADRELTCWEVGGSGKQSPASEHIVTLGDPNRIWKPHYYFVDGREVLADTEENVADKLADGIWTEWNETGKWPQGDKVELLGRSFVYREPAAGSQRFVLVGQSGVEYHYPITGPFGDESPQVIESSTN